nr:uncharacterized protein LOC109149905 [Ipomoea trifida]
MEHLPIHLAYEARIAGPVQYRWMYPFERYLRKLKNNVKNKAKVEGSISNAYLVEEASSFCSYYFEDHVSTKHKNVPRNADGSEYIVDEHEETLSIFKYSGRAFGKAKAHDPSNNISNKFIKDLAKGPLRSVNTYSGYYVNGFKFHTIGYGGAKETMNSGVCIKGINYSVDESDYYGRLVEVVQVEYPGLPIKRTILFKCEWFDPTSVGMKVHPKYKLVEVNHKRRFNRYEPFVLAMQAAQVYYCTYPSLRRDKLDWWAVCKIKARSNVEIPESSISAEESLIPAPFQEETTDNHDLVQIDEDPLHLDDPNGGVIELDGEHGDIEDEIELEEEIDDSSGDSVIGDSDNGGSVGSTRGRGRGAPPLVEPIVAPPRTVVSPPVQSPASIGSPSDLSIPSPSNSTAPPTSSSVAGSSIGSDLTIIHVEDGSTMTKIFTKMIHPNGYTWKNVPIEYKDLYFEEFKKFYKWDESIEAQVRKAFLAQAGLRYADMLSKFKTKRTSTGRPDCVAEETWAIWEAYWDRPDMKAKSEQQRKNRMSEVEGPGTGCSKHTGGSRSAIEHYHKLREELQKEPNLFECFAQMHKKKDGMFVDERSKRIAEQVQARHDIATQEAEDSTESPNINMSQLYVDVVGGAKKQRIYGLGTKGSSFINGNSCGSSATSQLHQDAMKDMMNQQLETMRVDMEAKLQAEMDAKLQAERNQMQTQMQAQMQTQIQTQIQAQITSLIDELRRNGILSTSMPLPPQQAENSVNSNDENLGDD